MDNLDSSLVNKITSPKAVALKKYVENDPIVARKWVQPKRCETQHNSLCEICRKFFPNHAGAKLHCVYCNVVCHTQCMMEFHKKLVPSKEWICFYCIDFLDNSKSIHEQKQMESRNFAKNTEAQIIIAKYTRRFLARSFFIKIYNLIVYMQVRFRVNKRKQAFHKQVQSKLRPFHIKITKCSNLNLDSDKRQNKRRGSVSAQDPDSTPVHEVTDSVYVVVTVLDITKGQLHQTWRVTSELIPLDDAHFTAPTQRKAEPLSAALTHMPHLYTHVQHHHHPSHKHLHMDCSFLLGGVSGYNYIVLSLFQRGNFSRDVMLGQTYLDLSINMIWKRGGVFVRTLEAQDFAVKDHMGMDIKTDFRAHPEGSIEFEILPVQGLCSGCGVVYTPCTEDLVRIVSLQNRFSGFTLPTSSGLEKRKYTGGTTSYNTSLHLKKSWIAIADGRIYMYSHFGDSLKLKINVEHFSFYAVVRNKCVVYILRTPDFPDLEFYTTNKEEELRWKCAFLSTFRYKHSGSMVVSGNDTYDMKGLIKDLSLLEVNRYNGRDSTVMSFFSPTAHISSMGSKSGSAKVVRAEDAGNGSSGVSKVGSSVNSVGGGGSVGKVGGSVNSVGGNSNGVSGTSKVSNNAGGGSVSASSSTSDGAQRKTPAVSQPPGPPPTSPVATNTTKNTKHSITNTSDGNGSSNTSNSSTNTNNNTNDTSHNTHVNTDNTNNSSNSNSTATNNTNNSTTPTNHTVERQLTSISEMSIPSLTSMDSVSSIASSTSNDSDTAPTTLRHKPTRRNILSKTLISVGTYSTDDSSTHTGVRDNKGLNKGVNKGVFDEIDREIANIQAVKAKYKKEVKQYKDDRKKRVAAENGHIHTHTHHISRTTQGSSTMSINSTTSTVSNTTNMSHTTNNTSHTNIHNTHNNIHNTHTNLATVVKAVSLQSIKEAVSDIYEAEEGILNDKVNSVGARFITNILAAMKQRKVLQHPHPPT